MKRKGPGKADEEALRQRLAAAVASFADDPIARRCERGTMAAEALAALPDLPFPSTVHGWSAALGCTRQSLWEACRHDLTTTPQRVLALRLRATVGHLRGDGLDLATVARLVGYSSASALCNAFKRRGWTIPRRPRGRRVANGDQGT